MCNVGREYTVLYPGVMWNVLCAVDESDISELEKQYWSLKGISKSGRFDIETFSAAVSPPMPPELCQGPLLVYLCQLFIDVYVCQQALRSFIKFSYDTLSCTVITQNKHNGHISDSLTTRSLDGEVISLLSEGNILHFMARSVFFFFFYLLMQLLSNSWTDCHQIFTSRCVCYVTR